MRRQPVRVTTFSEATSLSDMGAYPCDVGLRGVMWASLSKELSVKQACMGGIPLLAAGGPSYARKTACGRWVWALPAAVDTPRGLARARVVPSIRRETVCWGIRASGVALA